MKKAFKILFIIVVLLLGWFAITSTNPHEECQDQVWVGGTDESGGHWEDVPC